MPQIRVFLSIALLALVFARPAFGVEALPMEAAEPACDSMDVTDAVAEADEPQLDAAVDTSEGAVGLQASGAVSGAARPQGGGDSSTPPAPRSSRWNAFLPGMVR